MSIAWKPARMPQSDDILGPAGVRGASLIASLFILAACSTQVDVVKEYEDPSAQAAPYERILVLAVAADSEQRRHLEDLVSGHLKANDIVAIRGYSVLGSSPSLQREAIDKAAASSGADGILISHIVATKTRATHEEGRVDMKSECRGGDPIDLFLYDYEELREPDSVSIAIEVAIVTNLYDARTGSRVWAIQSTCLKKASLDEVLNDEARAIVQQLLWDRRVKAATGPRS